MFRFPADPKKRQRWLVSQNLTEGDSNEPSHIRSKHFLRGDSSNFVLLNLCDALRPQ